MMGMETRAHRASLWTRIAAALSLALLVVLGAPMYARAVAAGTQPSPGANGGQPAAPSVIPAFRQAKNLAVITIEGAIDAVTAQSFARRLKEAIDGGADAIVVEVSSPGGEVYAVLEICSQIRSCAKHTIGWVHPMAYSGGAIIALACREIVASPRAFMGDAAPIAFAPGPYGLPTLQQMNPTERAKMLTPLLIELVDDARANGRDERLVCGFVMLGVELWMVEDQRSGKRWFVDAEDYAALFGQEPARTHPVIPSLGEAPTDEDTRAFEKALQRQGNLMEGKARAGKHTQTHPQSPQPEPADDRAFKGSIPGLPASLVEELNDKTSGLQQASPRPDFAHEDSSNYADLGYITDGKTLLTVSEQQMKDFQLAVATIANDEELIAFTGAQNLRRLDQSWSETVIGFMTTGISGMFIRSALIITFLVCMFLELSIPGATIPGVIAFLALACLVVPPMLMGMANWWALAAIIVGILLLLLEIFVIPGFGVAGVAGLVLLLAGLVGTFAQVGELFPGAGKSGGGDLAWSVSIVLLSFFVAGVAMFVLSKYTHSFPIAGRLVLATPRPADENAGMLEAMSALGPMTGPVRVGDIGVTTTHLRPSGTAEFADRLIDVVSEFGFVDAGVAVRVTRTSDFRVGVEPLRDAGPATPSRGSGGTSGGTSGGSSGGAA